ncbi:unnamed protein product [Rangifer tarandus platyrhynchus]|uniref:Uncharacterized protein n=1 Tax=Rangifer tarandus platyrhynchus TaxID=3082113 RepID=A0AC59YVP8_RANTA
MDAVSFSGRTSTDEGRDRQSISNYSEFTPTVISGYVLPVVTYRTVSPISIIPEAWTTYSDSELVLQSNQAKIRLSYVVCPYRRPSCVPPEHAAPRERGTACVCLEKARAEGRLGETGPCIRSLLCSVQSPVRRVLSSPLYKSGK